MQQENIEHFDLVVIGSGPAGFAAAMRAVDFNKKVAIVEAKHMGGAGVYNGALTSKTMWELSADFAVASAVNRGYRASHLTVDYKEVKKTVVKAAKTKQYQMLSQIETFAYNEDHPEKGSLTLYRGHAQFSDPHHIDIKLLGEDGNVMIHGDYFIVATGSRPRQHPVLVTDGKQIVNSDELLNLKKFPERMLIVGSGIIGCEFATIFSNFNRTEVHLLDRAHRVIPFEDTDVSDFVSEGLEKNGVHIHHTANFRSVKKKKDSLDVVLDYEDGHSRVIEVDVILVSIGRIPNTDHLCLENTGIVPSERGFLDVNNKCALDEFLKCHIFAAGDITGNKALYCVAEDQGRHIVEAIWANVDYPLDYSHLPTLMFFKPELASVGMNESQLRERKIPYKAAYYSNTLVNRAIAMQNTRGFVKIMISDDGKNKILGMRASGPQASAFITSFAYLLNQDLTVEEVLKNTHPHPSVTEGIQECLRLLMGMSIYKPEVFPDEIKVKEWRP
ncbi:NAD(P)/FAD-dependent oxidoreductase [Halosquirtibacter xylanolyticus]|uniref:dihydrolipoyl dehydrogenase family protein n=1 Tax=Halosquirtibacter xylanolyticus TaxID=3374599 RepID=UPI0037488D62|nr:NAD(P)/FAD-dependent oxidoreductase [Prolixibacteraceae bacterium]